MALKVGYVSDLHLEFQKAPNFSKEEGGDVLILAGDIITAAVLDPKRTDKDAVRSVAAMKKLKTELLDKYTYVYYVMGNHEHYRFTFEETLPALYDRFNDLGIKNVIIFDDDTWTMQGVQFMGSSLWSDFMKEDPNSMLAAWEGMNDYRIIASKENYGTITPEFILNKHKGHRDYIKDELKKYPNDKTVVITHHGPTMKSLNKKHSGNMLDGAYCSDLSNIMLDNPQIKYWVHGHTHDHLDYMVGECNVLANQRGYESYDDSFDQFTGIKHFEI